MIRIKRMNLWRKILLVRPTETHYLDVQVMGSLEELKKIQKMIVNAND